MESLIDATHSLSDYKEIVDTIIWVKTGNDMKYTNKTVKKLWNSLTVWEWVEYNHFLHVEFKDIFDNFAANNIVIR